MATMRFMLILAGLMTTHNLFCMVMWPRSALLRPAVRRQVSDRWRLQWGWGQHLGPDDPLWSGVFSPEL